MPTSVPLLCRGPERDRDLPKITQQGSGRQNQTRISCLLAGDSFQEEIVRDEPYQMDVTCTDTHHPHDSDIQARRPRPVPPKDLSSLPCYSHLLGPWEGGPGEDKRGQLCIRSLGRRHPLENFFSNASVPPSETQGHG